MQLVRYDDFGADDQGIVRGPEREIAWFTDPAGNSVSVVQFKTAPPGSSAHAPHSAA